MRIVNLDQSIKDKLRKARFDSDFMAALLSCDFLAIEENGREIVAACGIGGLMNVPTLQIDENFRGAGIGKKLLGLAIDEAHSMEG